MNRGNFRFPTNVKFGPGTIQDLPGSIKDAGIKKPLLVTDSGLAKLAVFKGILELISKSGEVALFDQTFGNPTKSQVEAGVKAYNEAGCDGFVIVGGGCAMDTGKAIAVMINHPGDLFDYEDEMEGARPFDQPIPFMIAVPTTAGTGSEVGASSVISDDETKAKKIIYSPRMTPDLVIADPELTVGIPSHITAATGIDALTHLVEAYLAKNYHPMCDGIALEGIKLVKNYLELATNEPENIEARSGMLMASMMGAVAFQKGLGATHSCAHALSTCYDLHHGLANAVMLVPVLQFNQSSSFERFVEMGRAIGCQGDDNEMASGFLNWVEEVIVAVKIPRGVNELGIEVDIEKLTKVAFEDVCHSNNPRLCKEEHFRRLFKTSLNRIQVCIQAQLKKK